MILVPILIILISLFTSNYFIGKGIIRYGESQMIHKWIEQKKQASEQLSKNGSKIVILSGSNTLYGVNAVEIGKKTGDQVLNYGIHGGLAAYIFYDAKRILKKGDTVFIPLEYCYYSDDYEINNLQTTLVEYTIGYDNSYYRQLPIKSKLKILAYLIRFDSLTALGKNVENQFELSSRGDIIDEVAMGLDKDYAKSAKPMEIRVEKLSSRYKEWELYKFIQWCKEEKIQIYAFAPNVYHKKIATKEEQESLNEIRKFYDLAGVKFIGKFEDGFFDLKYMYNTEYHLNKKGQDIRSNYFIQKIRNDIK
jgi:hypothetical protein